MSWIELDDGILDHEKFVRAVKRGGSDVIFMWLGLRAHCAKRLTDGRIDLDLLDEVKGPTGKARDKAIAILLEVVLLEYRDGKKDALWMHDYLDWSRSKEEVLESRRKARERKRTSRGTSQRDTIRDSQESSEGVRDPRGRDPTPLPTSTPPPRVRAPRRSQFDSEPGVPVEQWSGPDPMFHPKQARDLGVDIVLQERKFRAHYAAQGALCAVAQWPKVFTKWLENAQEFAPKGGAKASPLQPNAGMTGLEGVDVK